MQNASSSRGSGGAPTPLRPPAELGASGDESFCLQAARIVCESRTNSSAHYQTPPLRLRHVWVVRYRCLSIASGEHEAETIYFHATPHISRTQYTTNASRLRARLCSNHPLSTLAAVHNMHLALMQPAVAMLRAFFRLARDDSLEAGPAVTHDGMHVDRVRRRAHQRGC